MFNKQRLFVFSLVIFVVALPAPGGAKKRDAAASAIREITAPDRSALWQNPADLTSRNLFYGPGGKQHEPRGNAFTFIKEDLDGTNPKFVVSDSDGVKWKVKLGDEARPETAASRLVWAAGYYANEDYFLPSIRVSGLPRLKRGQKFVDPDGALRNVRLKRYLKGEEKIGDWSWRDGPFAGTRELNALRVMMALIDNWDLTEENNAVYEETSGSDGSPSRIYMVSDLGSTFGTPGLTWPIRKARGNIQTYSHSDFIRRLTPDYVDFAAPHRDSLVFLATPHEFAEKLHLAWIGKHIPRSDARWLGQLLVQLSAEQIHDAFRAAGYSPEEVEGFTTAVRGRIAELATL